MDMWIGGYFKIRKVMYIWIVYGYVKRKVDMLVMWFMGKNKIKIS